MSTEDQTRLLGIAGSSSLIKPPHSDASSTAKAPLDFRELMMSCFNQDGDNQLQLIDALMTSADDDLRRRIAKALGAQIADDPHLGRAVGSDIVGAVLNTLGPAGMCDMLPGTLSSLSARDRANLIAGLVAECGVQGGAEVLGAAIAKLSSTGSDSGECDISTQCFAQLAEALSPSSAKEALESTLASLPPGELTDLLQNVAGTALMPKQKAQLLGSCLSGLDSSEAAIVVGALTNVINDKSDGTTGGLNSVLDPEHRASLLTSLLGDDAAGTMGGADDDVGGMRLSDAECSAMADVMLGADQAGRLQFMEMFMSPKPSTYVGF